MDEIAPDVYRIDMPRPDIPAYLTASPEEPIGCHVVDGEETVLFGTGYAFSTDDLLSALDELGGVDVVVVEHADTDHYGAVPGVLDRYDDVTFAMAGNDAGGLLRVFEEIRPDVRLHDGDTRWGFRAISVPGHTFGNLAFADEARDLLIAGDTIVGSDSDIAGEGRWSGAFAPPADRFNANTEKAWDNLALLAPFDFDGALLTHGEDVLSDARDEFDKLLGDLGLQWELPPDHRTA